MKLLEYQAKELFDEVGIPTPQRRLVGSTHEATKAARRLGWPVMVKAQIPESGRMKAGGVLRATSKSEVRSIVEELLGKQIKDSVTNFLLIEEVIECDRELYLGVTMDRDAGRPVAMASIQGGIDVERSSQAGEMYKESVDPAYGLPEYQARRIVYEAGIENPIAGDVARVLKQLYTLWEQYDGTETEINPLIVTPDDQLCAVDAVYNIDPDALYRHGEFREELVADRRPADDVERRAAKYGFDYVRLNGSVGIIGNGAGLVMATQDLVAHLGGEPANFLDVGGGASAQRIADALDVVFNDPTVQVVVVNVFGGITRCDEVADGINTAIDAYDQLPKPVVVRLAGTNVEAGLERIDDTRVTVEQRLEAAIQRALEFEQQEELL